MSHVLIFVLALLLMWAPAALAEKGINWSAEHERGWFWYEIEPFVIEEPEPEPLKSQVPPVVPEGPAPLSSQWFKDNLEKYQMLAIDNPTPENIEMYMYLQKAMLDKAQRFSEMVTRVVQFDPFLDQNTRRPIATFGAAMSSRQALESRREVLGKISRQAGIFFFFKSDCQHCEIQAPLLKSLQDMHGFKIFPVSLDGRPLQNDLLGKFERDRGQARAMGVIKTPALFLGRPGTKEVLLLGQSSMARPQLEERIIEAAYEAGWITQSEYQSTRGMKSEMALDLKPGQIPQEIDEGRLLEIIKRLYTVQAGLGMGED